ncbi:MAG: PD-(D/E)XK nuclease family protein [Ignavibacteriales bacterium]|nr:PD-(D/E)XK nuclease family protein [Ignavibacteriales bacterium]
MIFTKEKDESVDIDFLINQKIQSKRLNEILLVVPTNRKIRYLKKELISLLPNKTTSKINLETIGTISSKLLSENFLFKQLSEAASSVLLKQTVSEIELKYLSGYKAEIPAGTLQRINNVISEYKRQGISPEKILADAENLSGSEKLKAEDIAAIYERYKSKCAALSAFEVGDVYEKLNELNQEDFQKCFKNIYPQVDLVVINGFDEFSSPEVEIINSISKAENTKLYLNFDYYAYNPLIFSHLDNCYNKLITRNFNIIEDKSYSDDDDFFNAARKNLFLKNSNKKIEKYKTNILTISALSREKEIELIAKEIKELILEKKVEAHKICVSFNLIEKYSPIIRDRFSLYEIPYNLTDRISLANSYPVISIINFLEILENDFYYKNIFRALSSGFMNFNGINLAGLMKSAAELKIVAGYDNWLTTLKDAFDGLYENSDSDYAEIEKKKDFYSKALVDIETLAEILSPFNRKLTLKEFLSELNELVNKLELPIKLILDVNEKEEEHIRAVTTLFETITEIFELLELELKNDIKFPLSFFLNQLRTAVSSARFNVKEKSNYGVQVTTINEIRGLKFDYLFISGLCDGDFPTRFNPEIFSSDSFAKSESIHQTEERYHFYQALCSWQKGLYLTFPIQEKGKELVQSNLLKDFLLQFDVLEKSEKDYDHSVFSTDEILKLIGQIGLEKAKEEFGSLTDKINWEAIDQSLKIADERKKDPFGESIYNGFLMPTDKTIFENEFILSEEAQARLKQLGEREYSITQLEQYAKCPYQYFLKRILNINIIKEPTEEIEAFELGTLLHTILYQFYKEITTKRIIIKNCSDEVFNKCIQLIFNIADKEVGNAFFSSPFSFYEKEKIFGIDGKKQNSILYKFLEAERENISEFLSKYFELGFGRLKGEENKNDLSLQRLSIGGINVRGKIDRLEIDEQEKRFSIVDYKLSGDKPSEKDLLTGLSLQLPLYIFAAAEMLKAQFGIDYEPANAFIYSLKFKAEQFGKSSISIKRGKSFEELDEQKQNEVIEFNKELIKICEESVYKYVEGIKAGKFNLSLLQDREQKVCRYCDFRSICRIQEVEQ